MEVGRAGNGGSSTEVSVNSAPRKPRQVQRQEPPREAPRPVREAPQPDNLGRTIDVKA